MEKKDDRINKCEGENNENNQLNDPLSDSIKHNIIKYNFLKKKRCLDSYLNNESSTKEKSTLKPKKKIRRNNKDNDTESDGETNVTNIYNMKSNIEFQRINEKYKNIKSRKDMRIIEENNKENKNNRVNKNYIEEKKSLNQKKILKNINQMENTNNQKKIPLNSYRSIQISTESPLNNNKEEKKKIFQVRSIPKFKRQNEILKKKREMNIENKYFGPINEIKNDNTFRNNFFINNKELNKNPYLFDNHNNLTNNIIKEQFQFDNLNAFNNSERKNNKKKEMIDNKRHKDSFSNLLNQSNSNINLTKDSDLYNDNNFNKKINNKSEKNNKNENKNNKSLLEKKIIVTKKEGKIVIKSIPIKNQEKKY